MGRTLAVEHRKLVAMGRRLVVDIAAVDIVAAVAVDMGVVAVLQNILDYYLNLLAQNHQTVHCLMAYKCFPKISILNPDFTELLVI